MSRPISSWHGFFGQNKIVDALRAHAEGALLKSEPFPLTLLAGPSGIGKTCLAASIAKEMQCGFIDLYGPTNRKKWEVIEKLRALKKGDVLFIDEIHAFPFELQEMLYPAIDRHQVPDVDPSTHRLIPNQWVEVAPFSLIAATDQPGTLRKALKQRFVMTFNMDFYNLDELRQIVMNHAGKLGILLTPQAATRLAEAARGLPRHARLWLESFRLCMQDEQQEVTRGMMDQYLASIGIAQDNLSETDVRYLKMLLERQGRASLETLALQLGLDHASIRTGTEVYLVRRGMIGIERVGRVLTPYGRQFCAERGLS